LKNDGGSIDLLEVVNEARARNLGFPLLIRFQDLLRHRVEAINRAFQSAISEFGYKNHYRGVFPIKVNQLREVVEEIVDAGEQFHFGLEAGSKPELVAALAMQKGPETLIICNGYKDPAFIRLALLGRKLGKPVVIVAEKLEEVEQIIRASKEVGVEPWIGIRARLHSKGSGKWSPSGGENAKFGLDTTNLVAASQMLKDAGSRIASNLSISTSDRRCRTFRRSNAQCAKAPDITQSCQTWTRTWLSRRGRRARRRLRWIAQRL
jgi:Arginine decarboxylase (spermidine biosynthesis)